MAFFAKSLGGSRSSAVVLGLAATGITLVSAMGIFALAAGGSFGAALPSMVTGIGAGIGGVASSSTAASVIGGVTFGAIGLATLGGYYTLFRNEHPEDRISRNLKSANKGLNSVYKDSHNLVKVRKKEHDLAQGLLKNAEEVHANISNFKEQHGKTLSSEQTAFKASAEKHKDQARNIVVKKGGLRTPIATAYAKTLQADKKAGAVTKKAIENTKKAVGFTR